MLKAVLGTCATFSATAPLARTKKVAHVAVAHVAVARTEKRGARPALVKGIYK